jgi:hypothetical protein
MLSMLYIILSVCSAFAKNTKCRISAPIINEINFFLPVTKSPNHTGLICVKKIPTRLGYAWAPLMKYTVNRQCKCSFSFNEMLDTESFKL